MSNAKGRLAEAWTAQGASCSPKLTDEGFSYTPRGEISDVYQSSPNSGGYYHANQTYWPNGVPNLLTGFNSSGGQIYGTGWNVDGEGRSYSNYNTGSNPVSSTAYNSEGQPTQLKFSSGDSDLYAYDPNTGRMTQYQFNVNGQYVLGNLKWNANGTLGNLNIQDNFNNANTQNCSYQHDDLVRIVSVNCPGQQLQNPGFESGNVDWNLASGWAIVNNPANAESGSWYLSGSGTTNVWGAIATVNGSTWMPVTPGEVLTYGGWIKRISGTGVLDWDCEIADANHNAVAYCGFSGGIGDGSGGTSWQFYQGQATVPSNGAYVLLYAEVHGWSDTDTSLTTGYFDGAILEGASAWSQTFGYDPFGNITKSGSSSFQAVYSSATNRITQIAGSTPSYDANGNVTNDFLHQYTWDTYGHPLTVDGVGLSYDALDRMVEQNRSGSYTQFLYSPTGFKMVKLSGQSNLEAYTPLPGGGMASYPPGVVYIRHADWLGSSRFTSILSSRTMSYDGAYGPFGEPYAQTGTADLSFTGMNQDTVANLYDFPAREYGIQGRWPSPDPAGLAAADPTNPQSWNRYAYVGNNPLAFNDPSGLQQQSCRVVAACRPPAIGMGYCPNAGYTCTDDDFFNQFQYAMQCGTDEFNTGCQAFAPRPGPNGTVQVFLPGGSISYTDSLSGTSGVLTTFEGTWLTLQPYVTAATDALGLVAAAAGSGKLGAASAIVSVANDHSPTNILTNGLGNIPGFGWPMAIIGAFNDLFSWGVNNSHPGPQKVGDPLRPLQPQPGLPTQDGGCLAAGLGPC